MSQEKHNPDPEHTGELSSLEANLASLAPATNLDRDKLLFEAGRAAGVAEQSSLSVPRQKLLAWTTAALLLLSLTTTALWLRQRGITQVIVENPPQEHVIPPVPDDQPRAEETPDLEDALPLDDGSEFTFVSSPARDYFELRDRVLTEGADALPQPPPRAQSNQPIPASRGAFEGI